MSTEYLKSVGLRKPEDDGGQFCACNDGTDAVEGNGGIYCDCDGGESKTSHAGDESVYCDCDGDENPEGDADDDDDGFCNCGREHVGKEGDSQFETRIYNPHRVVNKPPFRTAEELIAQTAQESIAAMPATVKVAELAATNGMPISIPQTVYVTMARRMVQHLKRRPFITAGPARLVEGKWLIPFMSVIERGPIHMQLVTVTIVPGEIDSKNFKKVNFHVQNVLRDRISSTTKFRVVLVPARQASRRASKP